MAALRARLHKVLAMQPALRSCTGEAGAPASEQDAVPAALTSAFATVDEEILAATRSQHENDGSTCVALLRVGQRRGFSHMASNKMTAHQGR